MAWVKNFIDRCLAMQVSILSDFPEEKKREGYGRAAKLIVDGDEGGIFELWFTKEGIQAKPPEVPVKNSVWMTDDTLLDLITPDIDLSELVKLTKKEGNIESITSSLYPRLDFRTALANGMVVVGGNKADVDSEEWSQIIERFLLQIAFPIVVRGLLRRRK